MSMGNFADMLRAPGLIRQVEEGECGLAALCMVAAHHRLRLSLSDLRLLSEGSSRGANLATLLRIASQIGLTGRALKVEPEELAELRTPAVLHWEMNHFVVLVGMRRRFGRLEFRILDPRGTDSWISCEALQNRFTGAAVEFSKTSGFHGGDFRSKLRISQLWGGIQGIGRTVAIMLAVSLVLHLSTLALPFYTKVAVDTAYPSNDGELLWALMIGFTLVALFGVVLTIVRQLLVVTTSNLIGLQASINIFRHMMRLPAGWFERRHVGDIVSRYYSVNPIGAFIADTMVSSLIDLPLLFVTLAVIGFLSPLLLVLTCATLLIISALKLAQYLVIKSMNVDVIVANARENTAFIETVRSIASIKSNAIESRREQHWVANKSDAISSQVRLSQSSATFSSAAQAVQTLDWIVYMYVALTMTIGGVLSLGLLFAIQAVRQVAISSGHRLSDAFLNYRLLSVHLGRLSDIVLSNPEFDAGEQVPINVGERPCIKVRGVFYRYSNDGPDIVRNLTLEVRPGELMAIIGPSGCGKTTALKLLSGITPCRAGTITINDTPLTRANLYNWREKSSSVLQRDTLFRGTLMENISLFEEDVNEEWVRECAEIARIDSDIDKMPMKYLTRVGDMGSTLSEGQRQRVLLARAIYRKPACLFLDEFTAHLDVSMEAAIVDNIRALECTTVMVAHRPQAVERADRIFDMGHAQAGPAGVGRDRRIRPSLVQS